MAPILFQSIQQHVVNKLHASLPEHLTYHSLAHTLDVLEQVQHIALKEGVTCPDALLILKVAALYHDAGFIESYQDHETQGCRIAQHELPGFGFSQEQIDMVCDLIRATKIPQNPQSQLEQIICDADLDYLGRDDFEEIADKLYRELVSLNALKGEYEWDVLQIKFLEKHHYFTSYSKQTREKVKQAHLALLKAKVSQVQ